MANEQPGAAASAAHDGSLPAATPAEVFIGTLPHPSLRLRAPLRLEVQREGDMVGVWSPEFEEYGYAPHLTAAIEDFQQALIELYRALEADQGRLGPAMVARWGQLQLAIEPRP